MKRQFIVMSVTWAALGAAGCHLDDSDRCDGDFVYDPDGGSCVEAEGTDTDTGTDGDADGDADGDTDADGDGGADDAGTGIGTPCEGQADCAGLIASYCLDVSYGTVVLNGCVIPGCTTEPDDCPAPNTCCDLDPTYEAILTAPDTLCMPPEYWAEYASSVCLNGTGK